MVEVPIMAPLVAENGTGEGADFPREGHLHTDRHTEHSHGKPLSHMNERTCGLQYI